MPELDLSDAAATERFGGRLAACCGGGEVVFLNGDLGTGKTTLVRGFLKRLGYTGPVKSPTYTLVESYRPGHFDVHHLDLYRLADPEELEWIGIRDLLAGDAVCLIEWPGQGRGILPQPDLMLALEYRSEGRRLRLEASGSRGDKLLTCLNL